MLYKTLVIALLSVSSITANAQRNTQTPVPIIFDTDMGPDYDDVGAIAMLHAFQNKGEAKILATIACNQYEGIASVLSVFNNYFKRPEIPIGVASGEAVNMRDPQKWTDSLLANYQHEIKKNSEADEAVTLYRKILAAQPDHSVTIVTVGFLTNVAKLLQSRGDALSSLSGYELVKKKVKLMVSMAGGFPSGTEFNIEKDAGSSKTALENWPTPVIYSGFEIGKNIKTGVALVNTDSVQNSPVKDAYQIAIQQDKADAAGRMSWDQTAVLVAVRGYDPYYTVHEGKIKIDTNGKNSWDDSGKGQYYLREKVPAKKVEKIIEELMATPPLSHN